MPADPAAIHAAMARLAPFVHRTPLLTSRLLDAACGGRVLLKAENLQRSGSFKFRGAYHALLRNLDKARAQGVITASSGNHGGALALAASMLGVRAVVAMPVDAPGVKEQAIRDAGAEVVKVGYTSAERLAYAAERAVRDGMMEIPPYDHVDVIAGQATCAGEIFAEAAPDVVLAPCGGGGLLAGTAMAADALRPKVLVYGVETETANDTWQSLRAGKRVRITQPATIADGMRTLEPGKITWPIVQELVKDVLLVSDDDVRAAMRFCMTRLKMVVEPTGATGIAALLTRRIELAGRTAAVIVSGGNVDPVAYAQILMSG